MKNKTIGHYKYKRTFWITNTNYENVKKILKFSGYTFDDFIYHALKDLDKFDIIFHREFRKLIFQHRDNKITNEEFFEKRNRLFTEQMKKRVIIK